VKAFRFGLVMKGGSRIVLDAKKPVRIEKAFVLEPAYGQPARLVLDLAATDRESFMRAIAQQNKAKPVARREVSATRADPSDPRPLIVVDPGHGGIDTGTKGRGGEVEEKNIVLEFALLLRDQLEKSGKYRVAMTRTDDTFVALGDRVEFARERQASLFISLHADWLSRREGNVRGATVYTLSETASDAAAAQLADAENKADIIAGIDLSNEPNDVADILVDLARRETKNFSHQFARGLVAEMRNNIRVHQHPLKSAGFRVLKAPDVPSVLVELGYVSNKHDLESLLSDTWRLKAAETIVEAVDNFFGKRVAGAR
jgi:N-acetylmuramoyl-L-alanine amidase